MFFENQNKNVSMLFLSKETSTKDAKLKIQMMISMNENKVEKSRKCIWKENGFFKEQRTDLTIGKPIFLRIHLFMLTMDQLLQLKVVMQCILNSP